AQHLAGIVSAAAHLHHVGVTREIACAHLRIGLETAGTGDHRLGLKLEAALGTADHNALDSAQIADECADRQLEADLDAHAFGVPTPLRELARAAARHVDCDAAFEIALAVDLGVLLERLPSDADLAHPVHRCVRLIDQRLRELAVHAPLRHAVEI